MDDTNYGQSIYIKQKATEKSGDYDDAEHDEIEGDLVKAWVSLSAFYIICVCDKYACTLWAHSLQYWMKRQIELN